MKKEKHNYRVPQDFNPCHDCGNSYVRKNGKDLDFFCHMLQEKVALSGTCDLWQEPGPESASL